MQWSCLYFFHTICLFKFDVLIASTAPAEVVAVLFLTKQNGILSTITEAFLSDLNDSYKQGKGLIKL